MTPLEQVIDTLKECTELDLKITGTKKVTEPGVYLYLKTVKPFIRNKDSVIIQIILASTELTGSDDAIIPLLYVIRNRIRSAEGRFNGMDIFQNARALKPFENLLRYAITFETEIYSEVINETLYA